MRTYILSMIICHYPGHSSGPRFIKLKRYELVRIAHLHMRIVKIQRVGQSARILPIHVKEGDIRGNSTRFYFLVSGRPRSRELTRSRIFSA